MSQVSTAKPRPRDDKKAGFDKGAFYRTCRMLHGYLSAFAFVAIIFFCFTGILLNHPEWFEGAGDRAVVSQISFAKADIGQALASPDPSRALAALVVKKVAVKGNFSSGDISPDKALLLFDGPKGTAEADIDLQTSTATVHVTKAAPLLFLQDLHRGKNSGGAWRFIIDASAYVGLAMSVIGYILFFSLRFRLRTSLALTAVSLGGMVAVGLIFVH